MVFLKLDCGRSVYIDALDYAHTYAGLLMGRPNRELNDRIIETAKTRMAGVWGRRKTYIIPPTVDAADPAHPKLPEVQLTISLVCPTPMNDAYMASGLVVVLFSGECLDRPLLEVINAAVRSLAWEQLATDFDW